MINIILCNDAKSYLQKKESLFKKFFKTISIMIVKGFDNTITNVENDA